MLETPDAMAEDLRYLVSRGRIWYCQIASPRPLHGRTRKLVIRSLRTASLRDAQSLRWAVINSYRMAWERALADPSLSRKKIEEIAAQEHERISRLEAGP